MKTPDLSDADVQIIQQALVLHKQSLTRARNKEITGSDIHRMRAQQIADVDRIINTFFTLGA